MERNMEPSNKPLPDTLTRYQTSKATMAKDERDKRLFASVLSVISASQAELRTAGRDLTGLRLKTAIARLDNVLADVKAVAKLFPPGFDGEALPASPASPAQSASPAGRKPDSVA
jgi:hypothetical protein